MEISIVGQHLKLGESLQQYIRSRINDVIHKYFPHPIWAKIHFNSSSHNNIECDIHINEGTGHHYVIKSDAISDEIYSCFDLALAKLEKQLRKYKSKLRNKHGRIKASETIETKKFVITPMNENDESSSNENNHNPVIISEKPITISNLSVSQAVMIMDLESLPALMFKNSQTGRINMVYYKKCGNIAWVDTPE